MLFTDVVNSTQLLDELGEEQAEKIRREHFGAIRAAIAEHAGEEVKTLGDGFMIVFGSALDALRCAVDIQRTTIGTDVALRVGLHVGEPSREGDDYFGTPVVVARRLCDSADGGQILASDLVHAMVDTRDEFVMHDAGYLALKGLSEPVAAWEVAWQPETSNAAPLPAALTAGERLPFVGRDVLLDELRIQWKKAQGGHRAMAMLAGEPGIGKTRLAAEFAHKVHEDGATVLFGHCDEETLLPYQPFVEAFGQVIDRLDAPQLEALLGPGAPELSLLVPGLRERLPGLAEPMRSEPESERFRLFEAVTNLIGKLTESNPVVLVLDDLHWADKPSLLLLNHLFRAPADIGLLVVGTYRDTDLDRRHPLSAALADLRRMVQFERLAVDGLQQRDLMEFIDLLTGKEPPEEFARMVLDQTEGNPFFIGEVLRHLVESGAVSVIEGSFVPTLEPTELSIPEGVKEVIGRRLSRLSDETNTALAVAAVAGRDFDLDVLEAVTELDEDRLIAALDEAVSARLVTEIPGAVARYHFAHALVRETLYEELSTARRVRMHRRIADTIERLHAASAEPPLSLLAFHFAEAAGAEIDKAVHYGVLAGERALEQLAYEEAAMHFERTLQALDLADQPDLAKRTELLLALGDARDRADDREAGRAAYAAALDLARATGDGDAFGRAAMGWVGEWIVAAVRPESIAVLEEALARLPIEDSATRVRLLTKLSMESFFAEDSVPARVTALQEESLAMARRLGDPGALAVALSFFASYNPLSEPEVWAAKTREAIALGEQAHDAAAIHNARRVLMWNLIELGTLDEFDRELEAGEELATRVHVPMYAWYVPMWKSTRATMRGEIALGEALATEALTIGSGSDMENALQMFGIQLFAIRREQGRTIEVEDSIRGLIAQYPLAPAWRGGLALSLAERGELDAAATELDLFIHHGVDNFRRDGNWAIGLAVTIDAWELLGDHNAQLQIAYDVLSPFGHRWVTVGWAADAYGSVQRLLGVLAGLLEQWDKAEAHFRAGFEADRRTDGIRQLVRGHVQLANMYRRRGASGDDAKATEVARSGLAAAAGTELPVLTERLNAFLH